MALIACSECKKLISDQASTCPSCGMPQSIKSKVTAPSAKKPKTILPERSHKFFGILALVLIATVVLFSAKKDEKKDEASLGLPAAAAANNALSCGEELDCLAKVSKRDAEKSCRDNVEGQAKHSFEWTNWAIDGIFTQYSWRDRQAKTITLAGDTVKFQNGFGAWTIMRYYCDYDPAKKALLSVRVSEGRLPKVEK
ncbi:zinc ribbon domain-containing protein [Bradyrhizobium sp. AUGA SZCCT0182]|uniref:zinc ribbon domain-containing protein n=1 Tax=Bradyrhizobium sp. AUGA SZCCT0182 TaxID=2807667 RepID=UPI001BABC66E|nr:zinc ribbon domain-containing protein [Bradyrhizobium sp. AUGA SZCCT0182]MBR1231971.1 zinc ribbon domain-containing protein [Bradyrhizobium sp. AUGA SZCCT0182]